MNAIDWLYTVQSHVWAAKPTPSPTTDPNPCGKSCKDLIDVSPNSGGLGLTGPYHWAIGIVAWVGAAICFIYTVIHLTKMGAAGKDPNAHSLHRKRAISAFVASILLLSLGSVFAAGVFISRHILSHMPWS